MGNEESCSGDPAKRSGNEFLFQMQAIGNIEVMNSYNIKKIVTAYPHCFNTIKNEYLGWWKIRSFTSYRVFKSLIDNEKLKIPNGSFKEKNNLS